MNEIQFLKYLYDKSEKANIYHHADGGKHFAMDVGIFGVTPEVKAQIEARWQYKVRGHELVMDFGNADDAIRAANKVQEKSYIDKINHVVINRHSGAWLVFFGDWSFAEQLDAATICDQNNGKLFLMTIDETYAQELQKTSDTEIEINRLAKELVEIGKTDGFIAEKPGGKFDETNRNIRAREIGEELNRTGGFQLMQTVHRLVDAAVTDAIKRGTHPITGSSRSLDIAWDGVGDWRG